MLDGEVTEKPCSFSLIIPESKVIRVIPLLLDIESKIASIGVRYSFSESSKAPNISYSVGMSISMEDFRRSIILVYIPLFPVIFSG